MVIVFDNYDDPSAFNLLDFIPQGESGRILVTSRNAGSLIDPESIIHLEGLAEADAWDLLMRQSQLKHDKSNIKNSKLIVARLGYHALAITQAGSYIAQRKIQLQQFVHHYNRQRKDILQQTPQMTQYRRKLTDAAGETALNVFTTWELSFQQLQTRDNERGYKEDVLILFAFFYCDDISERIFSESHLEGSLEWSDTDAGRGLKGMVDAQGN